MLESVGGQVPDDDIAKAFLHLVKDVGLNHEEIFGDTRFVATVEEVEREGFLGPTLDYVFGKRKKESTEKIRTRGMNMKVLVSYMELFKNHQEEKEKQQKKQKMKRNVKQTLK